MWLNSILFSDYLDPLRFFSCLTKLIEAPPSFHVIGQEPKGEIKRQQKHFIHLAEIEDVQFKT